MPGDDVADDAAVGTGAPEVEDVPQGELAADIIDPTLGSAAREALPPWVPKLPSQRLLL